MPRSAPLRIQLPCNDALGLVQSLGAGLAPGGIALLTRQPRALDEAVRFELVGSDGALLLSGHAAVARTLEGDDGTQRGLLLRFTKLSGAERSTLDRLLRLQGPPLELGLPRPPETSRGAALPPHAALAIDLGGTFVRAARIAEGQPVLIPVNGPGSTALPAAVALDERHGLVIGSRARAQGALDPTSGLASPLPLLALNPRRERDAHALARLSFALLDGPDGPIAHLPSRKLPALDLFAAVVSEVKSRAQDDARQSLSGVHFVVSPVLSPRARHLVQLALLRAGFAAPVLVADALAVAAFHGFTDATPPPGPLAVIDWGGTTLQVSILGEVEGKLEVLASGQKHNLGGAAVDERIARMLLEPVERALGRPLRDPIARQRILDAAEKARVTLASQPEARVHIPFLALSDAGEPVDLDLTLQAASTLKVLEPALDQLQRVFQAVLGVAGLDPAALHRVLLAGGQCEGERVAERLASRFSGRISGRSAASAAVLGAALLAHRRLEVAAPSPFVLAQSVSVRSAGGRLISLLEAGTPLPARRTLPLAPGPATAGLLCTLIEGADLASDAGYLGALVLAGATDKANLTVEIDRRGILAVELTSGDRRVQRRLPLQSATLETSAMVLAEAPLPGESPAT